MLESILSAIVILFAVVGAVLLLCLFLMRLVRPRAGSVYELLVFLRPGDDDAAAKISYAAEKLRFSGDHMLCTLTVVDCGIPAAELETLQSVFDGYSFVRFLSLCDRET